MTISTTSFDVSRAKAAAPMDGEHNIYGMKLLSGTNSPENVGLFLIPLEPHTGELSRFQVCGTIAEDIVDNDVLYRKGQYDFIIQDLGTAN